MAGVPGSADEYADDQLRRGVHILLANMGFSSAQESQVNRLVECWRRTYMDYAQHTRLFMEAAQRTKPIVEDAVAALNHLKVPIHEVHDYCKQVKTNVLPPLPMFPALGPTEVDDETHYKAMYGPRPSEREMLIRPPHVPDYLPAMHPEWLPNKGLSDVVLEYEKKKKKDVVKVQAKKKDVKKPLKLENKCDGTIPVFDGMSFEELGFVDDEEEEAPPVFKSDITSATGITSSANLTSLPSRISADTSKNGRFPTPSHSPKPNDSDSGPSENFRMSDIVKSRVNSPMPFDRPSSSSSMHMYDGVMKPIKFTTKPERPKKEKEPKGPPKPKGRPPKKKPDESYKHKADYLAEQEKRLKMFKENKEREELAAKKLLESISQAHQLENARKLAEALQQQAQQKKLKLILPPNPAKLFSPKSDAIVPSEAATPPISSMVCNPPPVGAEVSVGEVAEEEIQITGFSQPSSSSAPDSSFVTSSHDANNTIDSTLDSTADETSFVRDKSASTSETPTKEKKKKHKEKDREREEMEDPSSSKKHKKKSKDSEEYKEYKRQKKERKRLEKEKQEKEKAEADAKAEAETVAKAKSEAEAKAKIKISQAPIEEPKQKLTLKIKFSDGNGTISGGTGFTSTPMRPESSSSSERPGSSRELYEKTAAPPPLKLKFKPLFGPEVTEKKVVPPLKIGMVKKPEEATSSSSSSSLTEKEMRRKEKEKKRERKEKEREKERERERERDRDKEREKRKEEERRQREEEKAKEVARQREADREKEKREIEKRKESERREAERREAEKAKEAEKQKELERQKEKERAREKEKRKEEKRKEKEKKHKKREKSREPSPSPPSPPPPPPPQSRPIVPILSADDDDESSSEEEEVWICPVCSVAYTEGANMVCCDQCDDWFHWHCVGLVVEPAENVKWYCQRCLGKKKKDLKRPSSRESGGSSKKKRKL